MEIAGDKEIFTINVRYDTGVLYGNVKATRKITVAAAAENS